MLGYRSLQAIGKACLERCIGWLLAFGTFVLYAGDRDAGFDASFDVLIGRLFDRDFMMHDFGRICRGWWIHISRCDEIELR